MNYARQQDRPFRMFAAFVAVVVVLTLTVAAVPAQAQTYKVLYEFPINGPAPQWPGGPLAQGRNGDLYGWSYEGGTNKPIAQRLSSSNHGAKIRCTSPTVG